MNSFKTTRSSRLIKDRLFWLFCWLSVGLTLLFFVWVVLVLCLKGLDGLSWHLLSQQTPPPNIAGGLSNAIWGSLVMSVLAIVVVAPLGILIATFMVEFCGRKRFAKVVRFVNDILLSAPSIVIGLFVYALIVVPMGHFSGLAGAVALGIVALPMIVRASEDVLYLVSPLLRESAVALGISRWRVTVSIIYRSCKSGLITAVLLALARIFGETAPLLFTALNNQFHGGLLTPLANLPVVIFQYAMSPYANWQKLAWSGALLVTLFILAVNIVARIVAKDR